MSKAMFPGVYSTGTSTVGFAYAVLLCTEMIKKKHLPGVHFNDTEPDVAVRKAAVLWEQLVPPGVVFNL